jgi:hypothetical protein
MRRFVALLTLVTLEICGCSKAVVVPREELDSAEYRKPGNYRNRLHGWNEYHARRFSMTDSTVVIDELLQSDDHYKVMRHDMPIVVPLKDVENISVMKTNWPVTGLITGACLAVGYYVWAASGLSGLD